MTLATRPPTEPTDPGTPAERHTSEARPWALVAAREIIVRVTNRTFLVSTLVTLVLMGAFAAFSTWQSSRGATFTVAVTTSDAGTLVQQAATAARAQDPKVNITARRVPTAAEARRVVTAGDADAWLHPGDGGWVLTSADQPPAPLAAAVTDTVRSQALERNAAAAGTSIAALERGASVQLARFTQAGTSPTVISVATFAFALLFYFASLMFGQMIAMSVVEEKQSRIVEIIATAIPLRQLLAGKVLGNCLIAFAQILLYAAVGLVALSFTSWSALLPSLSLAVVWFVVFFVVGFVSLASLFAVSGALASRTEDLQSTTAPISIALMLVYFASFSLAGTAKVVASFVPIVSVIAMPARVLAGTAAWWEPVVALALMVALAAVTVAFAARVYTRSLMQTHGRVSWRQALTAGG